MRRKERVDIKKLRWRGCDYAYNKRVDSQSGRVCQCEKKVSLCEIMTEFKEIWKRDAKII